MISRRIHKTGAERGTSFMSRKWGNRAKKLDFAINSDGCFLCTTHNNRRITPDGYESIRVTRAGKQVLLHRWIYEEMFGPIPPGMVVLHKCDNSLCINPEHMQIGTQKENVDDMIQKGRANWQRYHNPKGE